MQFHPKVTAGMFAGAATGILISEASRRGVPIDAGEGANITMLISFAAAWFMPGDDAASNSAPNPPIQEQPP